MSAVSCQHLYLHVFLTCRQQASEKTFPIDRGLGVTILHMARFGLTKIMCAVASDCDKHIPINGLCTCNVKRRPNSLMCHCSASGIQAKGGLSSENFQPFDVEVIPVYNDRRLSLTHRFDFRTCKTVFHHTSLGLLTIHHRMLKPTWFSTILYVLLGSRSLFYSNDSYAK